MTARDQRIAELTAARDRLNEQLDTLTRPAPRASLSTIDAATLHAVASRARNDGVALHAAAELVRRHTMLTNADTPGVCRARFDLLAATAADLKTTRGSASAAGFGREAAQHGYPIQDAHYRDVMEWITGERPPMVFVVVEKTPPHFVAVHQFDDVTRLVARDLAAKARRIYAECKASGDWPGYGDDTLTPQIPGWWINQADEDTEIEF